MSEAPSKHQTEERRGQFRWTEFEHDPADTEDGRDVVEGLTSDPKVLPPKYFYDDRGSLLFEEICDQPEYYPTRTEAAILDAAAPDIAGLTGPCELIELGSGSARKTRSLLEAYLDGGVSVRFLPVDVSGGILKESSRELIDTFPELEVWGLIGTYEQALAQLPPRDLPSRMLIFLGSTLGNLSDAETDAFLERAAAALKPGEYFLLGIDLQKSPDVIEAAYNDARGVTAAFNLNMLRHLNRRYGGDFDLSRFQHRAFYNIDLARVEMHLRSTADQSVVLDELDLTVDFERGETIRTEISRKFTIKDISRIFERQGFAKVRAWTDPNEWFALVLFRLR